MKKVLFLCTGNSCRSQMAEGLCRQYFHDSIAAYSAGVERHGMNPYAIKTMAEIGIDISSHSSKLLSELTGIEFDLVITVCDKARESCPIFPGNAKVIHNSFDDPPHLAIDENTEEGKMKHYRRVRDEIDAFIKHNLQQLLQDGDSDDR